MNQLSPGQLKLVWSFGITIRKPKRYQRTRCLWAILILLGLPMLSADAAHYQLLKSFGSFAIDGSSPLGGLIQASDGAFYGTTSTGGSNNLGIVFRLNKDGSAYTVLRHFEDSSGAHPQAALVEGSDGALYGTCSSGGAGNLGAVFRNNKDGSGFTNLHSFYGNDGANPQAALIEANDGVLYGTTRFGGTNLDFSANGGGTIFRLNKSGSGYTLLHQFGATNDGFNPMAALLQASDGALYGTTRLGGTNDYQGGTVFKLNKDGSAYSVLHSFARYAWGANPVAALVEGSDGALYGTSAGEVFGGGQSQKGTNGLVFKLEKDGSGFTALVFLFGDNYGVSALAEGSDGAFYGTAAGDHNWWSTTPGRAFKLNKDGSDYGILRSFGYDPRGPSAALVKGSDGTFYGVTEDGGGSSLGTIFKLWPPETPDIVSVTTAGSSALVTLTGVGGYNYQLLRSTDLANWSVLTNLTMSSSGIFTNLDNNPPTPAAYYRAAWVP